MRKFLLGAAAIALAAGAAGADPGNGKGGGNGGSKGSGHAMNAPHDGSGKGNGGGKADRGPEMKAGKAERGFDKQAEKADRGFEKRADRTERDFARKVERRDDREFGRKDGDARFEIADRKRGGDDDFRVVRFDRDSRGGLIDGCPPGLAKKNNGCMPPGLAKDRVDYRESYYRPSWFGYNSLGDGRYFYDDGYLFRMNNSGNVLGYIPLLGGALSVGNPWPSYYDAYPADDYYVQYYNLGQANSYRYADDVFYRVDPQTSAITGIAALLTGDRFAVGQPLPMGYDVYNVPYAYRDRYVDGPDAYYRYSDGYVYQVDPTTQLIQAAIELLV